MLKKLFSCIGIYKIYAILTPIMIIGEVILEVFMPFLMSKIVDVGIKNGDVNYIMRIGGLMILMAIVSLTFGVLSGRFAALAATGLAEGIRKKLFQCIQDFSFANVDRFSTASLITRLTIDVSITQNAFMIIIRLLARAPVMMLSATIMAVIINSRLSLVFLIAIPILGVLLAGITITSFPLFQKMLKKYDLMNASVQENLVAIRVVKSFVRKDYENEKFEEAASALRDAEVKAQRILIFNLPIMMFTMYGCTIAIVWFGGNLVISGDMQTGELFSFIGYISQILVSLMLISFAFVSIVMSRASVGRIIEVFDEQPDIDNTAADTKIFPSDGSVVFENVSFSYAKRSDNLTLTNVNLRIDSGETIGIIGGTGSAKTTLVQLIPRLYDVFDGRVLVGGHDVRNYPLQTLRDEVAMVLQKNVLFSGTIRENLKWGKQNATDTEIEAACKAAQAHDFIISFPDGYETILGQGGINLSGGQKQRICIARALLKKPKILILDDSTSAVDTFTESKIRQAFKKILSDTTIIVIAQRITSVSEADKIVVMHEGKICDVGTHEELLKSSQIYREVYESQQKGAA